MRKLYFFGSAAWGEEKKGEIRHEYSNQI
jgi:hypothetical protein